MKVELHNNGVLVESKNMVGTIEFSPSGLMPTRIGMSNLQTLMIVYHVPEKLVFIELDPVVEGKHSYMVGYYAGWWKECIDELLVPIT